MRKREGEYLPSPWARRVVLSTGVVIHILPAEASVLVTVERRLAAAYEQVATTEEGSTYMPEGPKLRTITALVALATFCIWDAADVEWDSAAKTVDADSALFLEGPALVTAAETCRREMLSPAASRLGITAEALINALFLPNSKAEAPPAPGEATPAES